MLLNPLSPEKGDVWMLHDETYNKKENIIPSQDVKIIHFDRPCIVINVINDIVTVIPLTSNLNNRYGGYQLQIEENRISYALLSQILTVERHKLNIFIGKVKKDVMQDLTDNLTNALNNNEYMIERNIPRKFNTLDVNRFYSFHIYKKLHSDHSFMILKVGANSYIEIQLILPWSSYKITQDDTTINTLCGTLLLNKVNSVVHSKLESQYHDIGFEFHRKTRIGIIDYFYGKYKINVKDVNYIDHKHKISKALLYFYGRNKYIYGYKKIHEAYNNANMQRKLIKEPYTFFNKEKNNPRYLKYVYEDILMHLNPLKCDRAFLDFLAKNNQNLLNNLIIQYKDIIYFDNKHSRLFDGTKIHEEYVLSNMKWIANYFIKKQNS